MDKQLRGDGEEPILRTEALTVRFGGLTALNHVDFAVRRDEIRAVIGPNGAGKSTFINLVTGHIKPTSGHVLIEGQDMTGAKPWAIAHAGVARTFQIVKPFRGMSVRENVAVGILYGRKGVARMSQALEQADEVLKEVGLGSLGDRAPGGLSVADARRLEFAKALALRPRLLLLDEVMAGLRHSEIEPSLELIKELKSRGLTIIVVEHDLEFISLLAKRVTVLHRGAILLEDSMENVARSPLVREIYLGKQWQAKQ